jgi:hypothetical protein
MVRIFPQPDDVYGATIANQNFLAVRRDFWPGFTRASGVFCMGEVLHGGEDSRRFQLKRAALHEADLALLSESRCAIHLLVPTRLYRISNQLPYLLSIGVSKEYTQVLEEKSAAF